MNTADVIVLGLGGMGAAAAWQLARRGHSVLGLEQLPLGHDQGSSHGHTRIIREAYYEHPAYVPLVQRAYRLWYELEYESGEHLLTGCPCLSIGPEQGELVQGVLASARTHGLPVDLLSSADVVRRFPAFTVPADVVGVVEHSAGFLYVDRCVRTMAEMARRAGADLRERSPAVGWKRDGPGGVVVVETADGGRYEAKKLVITAGPWAGRLLGDAGRTLKVMRQVPMWFPVTAAAAANHVRGRFPIFIADTPEGYYYGLPAVDRRGVKVARHYGADELAGVEQVRREVRDEDEAPVREFLRAYLREVTPSRSDASVCIYTLTPDRHFLVDRHPADPESVVFAAGFSGHGFKFAPVVGEVLADLAFDGSTAWPIDLFRLGRPALGV